MGYEYTLKVPNEFRDTVAKHADAGISQIFERLPADAPNHVSVTAVPEGLLICDHLSHESMAAVALKRTIQWLLRYATEITVEEA
ncbi:hypothetical protein C8C96_3172 [Acidovorax sp. 100]|uniref:hypothetical protein n=1 Tax=Acidovorax sp. 100 TaxID=2135635 RepID=UPI000EF9B894|nr:hypothetical protein [Acidovorax sp. 100]RMA62109.1 hypothetical protein C8C96_3172 [Acidovorax sp. 100]